MRGPALNGGRQPPIPLLWTFWAAAALTWSGGLLFLRSVKSLDKTIFEVEDLPHKPQHLAPFTDDK
ncbi:hypothetical protein GCM10009589_16640 [Arthrobacter pascens]